MPARKNRAGPETLLVFEAKSIFSIHKISCSGVSACTSGDQKKPGESCERNIEKPLHGAHSLQDKTGAAT
jgi:hypothetical protein